MFQIILIIFVVLIFFVYILIDERKTHKNKVPFSKKIKDYY